VEDGGISTYPGEPQVEVLQRLGLVFDGDPLRELKGSEAQRLLFEVFSRPLVYTSSGPVVSEEGAEILAQTCTCSLFPANAQYYTNVAADWPEITRLEGSSPSVRVTPSVLVSSQSPRRRLHASGSRKKTSASPRSLSEVSTNA
jgi:hypothetical protein